MKIAVIDITQPDYFRGYHLPCIAFPINYGKMTIGEAIEAIEQELLIADFFHDDLEPLFDEYLDQLRAKNPDDWFYLDESWECGCEAEEDYFCECESLFCYMSAVDLKTVNVNGQPITFLS